MKNIAMMLMMGLTGMLSAQTGGTVSGRIYNADSTEVQPFSIVRMEVAGVVMNTKSDINGKYWIYIWILKQLLISLKYF